MQGDDKALTQLRRRRVRTAELLVAFEETKALYEDGKITREEEIVRLGPIVKELDMLAEEIRRLVDQSRDA